MTIENFKFEQEEINVARLRPKKWKGWTIDAINCYKRGLVCRGCPILEIIESGRCYMKVAVMELVKRYGVPDEGNCGISKINATSDGCVRKEQKF